MRGVQGRAPDLAAACASRESDGFVQLRVDIPPDIKDALVGGAAARGRTLRSHVEHVLWRGMQAVTEDEMDGATG